MTTHLTPDEAGCWFPHRALSPARAGARWLVWVMIAVGAAWAWADEPQPVQTPVVDAVFTRGVEAFNQGDFGAAIEQWQDSTRMYQVIGDVDGQIDSLRNQATAHRVMGQFRLSHERLILARDLAVQVMSHAQLVAVYADLGTLSTLMKRWGEAQEYLENALALADEEDHARQRVLILLNLGNLHLGLQQYDQAMTRYERTAQLAQEQGYPDLAATAFTNACTAANQWGRPEQARALLAGAQRWVAQAPDGFEKAYLLTVVGHLGHRLLPRPTEPGHAASLHSVVASYRAAIGVAQRIGDNRSLSVAMGQLAKLYEEAGRLEEALALTQRAVFTAQESQAANPLYLWQWQTGRLLDKMGRLAEADDAYRTASDTLEPIRQDVTVGHSNALGGSSFRREVGGLYFEHADLLLRLADAQPPPATDDEAEAKRFDDTVQGYLGDARDAIERFKAEELVDYFEDECFSLMQAKTVKIEELARHTAVLYLIPLNDRTELLLSFRDKTLKRFRLGVDKQQLTQVVRAFRTQLEDRNSVEHLEHAKQLYRWLIAPIEHDLEAKTIDTIVFVPDGALRTIPLAALHDGQGYLVERYATAVTQGLTLTDARPIAADVGAPRMLAAGLSLAVHPGFPALDHVPEELDAVVAQISGTKLLNEEFRLGRLEVEVRDHPYGFVHIASHGVFGDSAKETFVLAYDTRLTLEDLEALIRPGRYRDQPVEMLVLSACETASGDDESAARSALGLAGVGLKAGARSTMATLWSVDDEATTLLIKEFYRQIRDSPGISKAKALQRAQLKLFEEWKHDHPLFWSPFLVVGNWL